MKRNDVDVLDLVRRYRAGESEKALSKAFKIARSGIRPRLLQAGIKPRDKSAAMFVRMQRTSKSERMRLTEAAHTAARGRKASMREKIKRARTRQDARYATGQEIALANEILRLGGDPVLQEAVGPYNCDVGLHPVAVEIFGGNWHWSGSHMRNTPKRLRYFLDRGWSVLMVWVDRRASFSLAVAQHIVAYAKLLRSDPARLPEYRVIRCTGELVTGGRRDDDKLTIELPYTRGRNTRGQYERVPR